MNFAYARTPNRASNRLQKGIQKGCLAHPGFAWNTDELPVSAERHGKGLMQSLQLPFTLDQNRRV